MAPLAIAALGGAPAGAQTPAPSLAVHLSVLPEYPHVGTANVEITVLGPDGKPVSGAAVMVLASMPAMRMGSPMPMLSQGMLGPEVRVRNLGNGHYRGLVTLDHATIWTFVVHARKGDAIGTRSLNVNMRQSVFFGGPLQW
jgi:hypothetical protein